MRAGPSNYSSMLPPVRKGDKSKAPRKKDKIAQGQQSKLLA